MGDHDPQSVVDTIDVAFAGLSPPGDDRLLHPQCFDDGDIADFYGAPDWRQLTDEIIIDNYAALSFFGAEAFQYYLPAFMAFSATQFRSPHYVVESTVRALDPMAETPDLRSFQISKYANLTDAQRGAITEFLEFMSVDTYLGEIAGHALARYWRRGEDT